MSDKFSGRYVVSDGFVGNGSHAFTIHANDLEDGMTDDELLEFYEQEAQAHFEQHVTPSTAKNAEFLVWAHDLYAKRNSK